MHDHAGRVEHAAQRRARHVLHPRPRPLAEIGRRRSHRPTAPRAARPARRARPRRASARGATTCAARASTGGRSRSVLTARGPSRTASTRRRTGRRRPAGPAPASGTSCAARPRGTGSASLNAPDARVRTVANVRQCPRSRACRSISLPRDGTRPPSRRPESRTREPARSDRGDAASVDACRDADVERLRADEVAIGRVDAPCRPQPARRPGRHREREATRPGRSPRSR